MIPQHYKLFIVGAVVQHLQPYHYVFYVAMTNYTNTYARRIITTTQ